MEVHQDVPPFGGGPRHGPVDRGAAPPGPAVQGGGPLEGVQRGGPAAQDEVGPAQEVACAGVGRGDAEDIGELRRGELRAAVLDARLDRVQPQVEKGDGGRPAGPLGLLQEVGRRRHHHEPGPARAREGRELVELRAEEPPGELRAAEPLPVTLAHGGAPRGAVRRQRDRFRVGGAQEPRQGAQAGVAVEVQVPLQRVRVLHGEAGLDEFLRAPVIDDDGGEPRQGAHLPEGPVEPLPLPGPVGHLDVPGQSGRGRRRELGQEAPQVRGQPVADQEHVRGPGLLRALLRRPAAAEAVGVREAPVVGGDEESGRREQADDGGPQRRFRSQAQAPSHAPRPPPGPIGAAAGRLEGPGPGATGSTWAAAGPPAAAPPGALPGGGPRAPP